MSKFDYLQMKPEAFIFAAHVLKKSLIHSENFTSKNPGLYFLPVRNEHS